MTPPVSGLEPAAVQSLSSLVTATEQGIASRVLLRAPGGTMTLFAFDAGQDIIFHIERGDLLDVLEHPNPSRDADQRIFVVRWEGYAYLVPFVEDEQTVFLKTIFGNPPD